MCVEGLPAWGDARRKTLSDHCALCRAQAFLREREKIDAETGASQLAIQVDSTAHVETLASAASVVDIKALALLETATASLEVR